LIPKADNKIKKRDVILGTQYSEHLSKSGFIRMKLRKYVEHTENKVDNPTAQLNGPMTNDQ
jgi:hypothetical protein